MIRRLLAASLLLGGPVHPLHTTHTEIVDRGRGEVTITVRAFTDDLHLAVAHQAVALTDSALAEYVRRTVELRSASGERTVLRWEGARTDGEATLLTLRARVPSGLRGMRIRQTMHAELFSDQVNVVQARYGDRRMSFLFTPGDEARQLP